MICELIEVFVVFVSKKETKSSLTSSGSCVCVCVSVIDYGSRDQILELFLTVRMSVCVI